MQRQERATRAWQAADVAATSAGRARSCRAAGRAPATCLRAEGVGVLRGDDAHPAAVALAVFFLLVAGVGSVRRLVRAGALSAARRTACWAWRACSVEHASDPILTTSPVPRCYILTSRSCQEKAGKAHSQGKAHALDLTMNLFRGLETRLHPSAPCLPCWRTNMSPPAQVTCFTSAYRSGGARRTLLPLGDAPGDEAEAELDDPDDPPPLDTCEVHDKSSRFCMYKSTPKQVKPKRKIIPEESRCGMTTTPSHPMQARLRAMFCMGGPQVVLCKGDACVVLADHVHPRRAQKVSPRVLTCPSGQIALLWGWLRSFQLRL